MCGLESWRSSVSLAEGAPWGGAPLSMALVRVGSFGERQSGGDPAFGSLEDEGQQGWRITRDSLGSAIPGIPSRLLYLRNR